jgi:hypothetical protein
VSFLTRWAWATGGVRKRPVHLIASSPTPFARSVRATAPPTFPCIPVTAYILMAPSF